jgi:2,3-bisphosphoglycerate-independent phosphoglycerate mutase
MLDEALRAELQTERDQLAKAELDISAGWSRLRRQQQAVVDLRAGRHNTQQAERLVAVTSETLVEWERHRVLIEQRIAHLQERLRD